MKEFIKKILAGPEGGISSKRIYSGILIISGIILAFLNLNPENVRTLIYGGCGLLGVGAFAERIRLGGGCN